MTNNPTIDGVSRVLLAPDREMRMYIAGPMTGIENYNFPAFNAVAEKMRAAGWHVENPADHGLVVGAEWGDYLRYDIGCLASCAAIMLLPGWTSSRGARLEVSIAKELGVAFMYAEGAEHAPAVERQEPSSVPRFWCHEAQNIRCVRESDYDALQSTIARLEARVAELESGRGEPVAWRYKKVWRKDGWMLQSLEPDHFDVDREANTVQPLFTAPPAPVAAPEKYDDVLLPFLALMRAELHANAHKGDRPGWLQMDSKTAILEVFYHLGKLHQAVHRNEAAAIKEYAADVANMCMMLLDVCACLGATAALNKS